jgi:hypothetical protein
MINDHVRLEAEKGPPFLVKKHPHQGAHVLEKLEARAETFPGGYGGGSLCCVKQRQNVPWQGGKRYPIFACQVGELNGSRQLDLMSTRHEVVGQCYVRLDISAGSEGLNGKAHPPSLPRVEENVAT